ncbi:MAG: (E)-4-hydroxy-3-methylbut-2-enyl-diphosphate synthase [Muribaculaceae bacterium]|nr:(E)-4-hydroxy-3-methylbut-2-enyl-diphosphate synthase [Muribaculaceae bacterium]
MANYSYRRRHSWPVRIGCVTIGGDNPIAIQSMTSTSTMDTPGSVKQIERIADAGGNIVRLTAQGVREAENLENIRRKVRADGYEVPMVADIHFNPKAAFSAASRVEKVRINPGNFVDPGRVFKKIEFTPEEYEEEIKKIDKSLVPLLDICKENNTTLRIGVNHGSLSDRIMSRYGDTPEGMVESAMEFLRVCLRNDFRNVVISIKASNVVVMTKTVRMLAAAMEKEDMHFPLHLGVTEAGDGEDGRIKSAVGIGSLLLSGIGDTIRVSLSEDPEREIEPARMILSHINEIASCNLPILDAPSAADEPRESRWSDVVSRVAGLDFEFIPEETINVDASTDSYNDVKQSLMESPQKTVRLTSSKPNGILAMRSMLANIREDGFKNPVVASVNYSGKNDEETSIAAAIDLGSLLLEGYRDGIEILNDAMSQESLNSLALNILQAARLRISKTEYIACPSCGRTLYDLQSTLKEIKAATSHLVGLKIGVMGCIVNGPGEMADADYGYVGAGPGRVSLYKGKSCVVKNIPTEEALHRLIELIKENGDWKEKE